PCFQDGPEFDFQEFRDTVGDFISDVSTLAPPSILDCTDFDFSLGEEVAFGPCTPQLQSSVLVQVPPQHLPSPELCWRDLAHQHQKALGDALELQETLTQRQEELVNCGKSNEQLKELASQARQLAAVLDVSAAAYLALAIPRAQLVPEDSVMSGAGQSTQRPKRPRPGPRSSTAPSRGLRTTAAPLRARCAGTGGGRQRCGPALGEAGHHRTLASSGKTPSLSALATAGTAFRWGEPALESPPRPPAERVSRPGPERGPLPA
uniref:MCIN protein n=1 Tax=Malurus cyaneus samueli TaxID=2593467 RepID=A0A8C5X1Y8_9PASS